MKKLPDAARFRRIIVVVTRQIGDVLLTTPLIRASRDRWPDARIDVLGFSGTLGVLNGNPDVNDLIEVKAGSGWLQSLPLIRRLWRRYDLALVAQYTDRAHLYGFMSARVRSGQVPAGPQSRWKRLLLSHWVDLGDDQSHVVLEKLRLLSPWTDSQSSPQVIPPPVAKLPEDILAQLTSRYVVIQVPSLVHFKQWPMRHYVGLVQGLASKGHRVVLTGGPSPEDRALVARVQKAIDISDAANASVVDACGRLNFNQMACLLAGSSLYIGPDTSITHLATAVGVPVIALYGPIDPRLWGPWPTSWPRMQPYEASGHRQAKGNVILLQSDLSCVPCNSAGCDKHRNSRSECLETLRHERVLHEALAVLACAD